MQVPSPWPCPGTSDTACRSWSGQNKTAVVQDERLAPNVLVSTLTVVIFPRASSSSWRHFARADNVDDLKFQLLPLPPPHCNDDMSILHKTIRNTSLFWKNLKLVQITGRKRLSRLWFNYFYFKSTWTEMMWMRCGQTQSERFCQILVKPCFLKFVSF